MWMPYAENSRNWSVSFSILLTRSFTNPSYNTLIFFCSNNNKIYSYLSLHNDDLEKAMTVALADLEWEKTQGCKETIDYSPPLSLHKFVDTTVALQMHNNRTDDGCSHGNTSERKRKHLIELQPVVNSSTCADNWEDISVPKSYKSVQDLTLQASGKDQLESRPIPKLIFSIPSSTGLRKRRSLSEVR